MKCNQTKLKTKYIKFENCLVFERKKTYNYEEVNRILFVMISIIKK